MTQQYTKKLLKECIGLHTANAWNTVYLAIEMSSTGVARVYINGYKTPFYTNGYGYDKTSTVLADFVSYYANTRIKSWGAGIDRLTEEALTHNIKIEYITATKTATIYKIENLGA